MSSARASLCFAVLLNVIFAAVASAGDIGQEIANLVSLTNYQHYLSDLLYTHNGDNRDALTGPNHTAARDNIRAVLTGFGLVVQMESFSYSGATCTNVVATQLGTVHPDACFIIGAHYDSAGTPGADDNASGVAGVLEIARILSAYESEYTIKYIAFDTEEYWMIGSGSYVDRHFGDDIRGMISMDMIAYDLGGYSAQLWGDAVCSPMMNALQEAVLEYGEGLAAVIVTEQNARGDHAPFQAAGFQACTLIESTPDGNPCYHQSCDSVDTPNYISYPFAVSMTRSVTGYLVDHAIVLHPVDCDTGQGCELGLNGDEDCNGNGVWDHCDIRCGTSADVNLDGIPDECQPHETWYVDAANLPGPGSGSQADPFCRIQDAINAAAGDPNAVVEIIVADGVYTGTGNKDLNFGGKLINLHSQNGPANCIIDCQGSGRGFYFLNGETPVARVDGFTIRNGNAAGSLGGANGGGVYCSGSSPTLTNCTIIANTANYGAGVYCYKQSSPTLTDCTINGNTAYDGGGVYCEWSSNPTLTRCTINGNTASYGGGVYCKSSNSRPVLTDCTISGNHSGNGAGVYCYAYATPLINNCTISGNFGTGVHCYYGGARLNNCRISNNSGRGVYSSCYNLPFSPTLINCVISGNTAGGVRSVDTGPTLINCTIAGNTAPSDGAGCYLGNATLIDCAITGNTSSHGYGGGVFCNSSSPKLTNCTISANTANSGGGVYCTSAGPALTNCTIRANTATGGSATGGGVYFTGSFSSSPALTNCTISGNVAASGGGVYCKYYSYDPGPTLTNCILWGDTPQEIYVSGSVNSLVVMFSDIQGGYAGTGNINLDPRFVNAPGGDFHLRADSPCIDLGNNAAVPAGITTDIDGDPRIVRGRPLHVTLPRPGQPLPPTPPPVIDMGADEFKLPPLPEPDEIPIGARSTARSAPARGKR